MLVALALALTQGLYGPAQTPAYKIERKLLDLDGLPIAVTWPVGAKGKLPVVVWSHGMYGSRNNYRPLVDALAGDGFAVIQPTHGDSIELMTPEQRRKLLASPNLDNTQSWDERPGEVSKCIDALPRLPKLAGCPPLDPDRIGIGGHSFGAWTTQVLAGMELSALNRTWSRAEPRAKAFVVLSGSGPGAGIKAAGLAKMRGPMLMITGTNDKARSGDTGEWRKQAFELASPGNKWLVWIDGATHMFGGIAGAQSGYALQFVRRAGTTADTNPRHKDVTLSAIVSFFDAHVRGLDPARTYWTSKTLERAGGVTISAK